MDSLSRPEQLPIPRIDVARQPLAWRLGDLSRRAEEAIIPSQLGIAALTIAAVFVSVASSSVSGVDLGWTGSPENYSLLAAGIAAVATAIVLICRYFRAAFRWAYRATATDLRTTMLPLMLADDSLLGLIVEIRDANREFKPQLPVHSFGRSTESKLQFAIRYYPALMSIARGHMPTRLDVDRIDQGCFPATLAGVIFVGMLFMPFVGLVAAPVLITMASIFTTERLQRRARLTAVCDYFIERNAPWLQDPESSRSETSAQ